MAETLRPAVLAEGTDRAGIHGQLDSASSTRPASSDQRAANDLPSIATEVRALHGAVRDHFRTTLNYARQAGDLLLVARKVVADGRWEKWLRDECQIDERNAQRYMRVARHWTEIEAQSDDSSLLSIDGALKLIAKPRDTAPPPAPPPAPVREQVIPTWDEPTGHFADEPTVEAGSEPATVVTSEPARPKLDLARHLGNRVQLKEEICRHLRHALTAARRLDEIEHAQAMPADERAHASMPIADLIARLEH
jgi:hypothetical protein